MQKTIPDAVLFPRGSSEHEADCVIQPRQRKKKRRAPLIVGLFFYSLTKAYGAVVKVKDAWIRFFAEAEERAMRKRTDKVTLRQLCRNGALKVSALEPVTTTNCEGPCMVVPPYIDAHKWNRALMHQAEFDAALKTVIGIYKESQGVTTLSHIDAHRLADHIYMRALVREGLITEAEYEKWENFR